MKDLVIVIGAMVAIAVVSYVLMYVNIEHFGVPEFLDRTQDQQTVSNMSSSYAQKTNHLVPTRTYSTPTGTPTPFRVNMFHAYV